MRAFLEQYKTHQPHAAPAEACEFASLLDWRRVASVLARGHNDFTFVRQGNLADTEVPLPLSMARTLALHRAGYTLALRHLEREDMDLALLADSVAKDFGGSVEVQAHCTPAGHQGFDWQKDEAEVFIVQTQGRSQYWLRSSTLLMSCILAPGDWLYIPSGYWHRAQALEDSMHLLIGVLPL